MVDSRPNDPFNTHIFTAYVVYARKPVLAMLYLPRVSRRRAGEGRVLHEYVRGPWEFVDALWLIIPRAMSGSHERKGKGSWNSVQISGALWSSG